ncbi:MULTISPECIES: Gfo/Idh/MocA family protein [unclassified Aureispira]|uniref:Gfo/Idh/MocA family protein n=1 Tax=unclassified Aureispira TaxID=2649989 RepID=UPI0006967D63|nr:MULTISPECIES: Gfo/Idh/MocA family oxidoreductase [unclassified Aureispira]WMX15764.1 Gfo/Idh/MocA family oxidoreductase [Aureispira sp. CCB-E]
MEVQTKKVQFAIVGAGHIGKRHAAMIEKNQEANLVALCDIEHPKFLNIEDFDVPFYNSIEALLAADLEIDVVCICTPNGVHAEQAILALGAHKHVVCEKPMGLSKEACEAVIFKSLQVNRHVFCVMQNRYSPPSIWVKEMIDQQRLGQIFMVQINCYWNRDDRYYYKNGQQHTWKGRLESDGGPLFTQFSHFVDILYWLFGDIKNIQAMFHNFSHQHSTEFEDSGVVQFDFVKGGMGCINYSTAIYDKNLESSLTIIGSEGSLKIGGQYMNEVEYCHIKDYTMPTLAASNPANDYGAYKGSAANHGYVIQNVIDVIKEKKPITTNALEGLKVVEIIENIYKLKSNNK